MDEHHITSQVKKPAGFPTESADSHIWGYLQPCSAALTRIDFWRINPQYTIGRNRDLNKIVFLGPLISGLHCVIKWGGQDSRDGAVLVTDLSSNGTYINGNKVGHNKTCILKNGNEIAFGASVPQPQHNGLEDYRFIYHQVAGSAPVTEFRAAYDVAEKIGSGSFAIVYKAVCRETGAWCAVKMITGNTTIAQSSKKQKQSVYLAREISIMKQLAHPNVCRLLNTYFEDDGAVIIVMELLAGGNLSAFVRSTDDGVEEPLTRDMIFQICTAMAYIHAQDITHRDLKLENILLTCDSPPLVKVADFGLAKVVDDQTRLRTLCGTPSYIAPEVFLNSGNGYNNLVDSWALGVMTFVMLTKDIPFRKQRNQESTRDYVLNRVVEWQILQHNVNPLTTEVNQFIRRLLERDFQTRMTLTAALEDPWLACHIPFHAAADSDEYSAIQEQEETVPEDEPCFSETHQEPAVRPAERILHFHNAADEEYLAIQQQTTLPEDEANILETHQEVGLTNVQPTERPLRRSARLRERAGYRWPFDVIA